MNKKVIIIGAGGHGRVIADIVEKSGDNVVGFLDDHACEMPDGFCILGRINDLECYKSQAEFVVGIGNGDIRERIMSENDLVWYTAIHPTAVIGRDVQIGEGSVLMANVVVNSGTAIGRGCIINTAATVDHDNVIGDYVHIAVGAHTAGSVQIGEKSWLGIGAMVSNNISVCNNCMIGAGAAVVKNLDISGIYVGIPARKLQ